jgi:hypothetical protein
LSLSASVPELEAVLTAQPESTNSSNIYDLMRKVYGQINQAWQQRELYERNLVYRVGVASNGDILGYKLLDSNVSELLDTSKSTKQTLNNDLLSKLVTRKAATEEPIIHFQVVFTKQGILEVSPWRGYR